MVYPLRMLPRKETLLENRFQSNRTRGWSRPRRGAQQELGRDRRQPCPGLALKPKAAGGAMDVEATMVAAAASATIAVAGRISRSRNISHGISESSSPRISRNNSSISRGTNESSPRVSRNISNGPSNISDRNRNSSTSGIRCDTSRSSPHSIQGGGVHHVFVSGVVNTGIFCRSAVQYPPRVFLTRTRARKLRLIRILKTTPILGAVLHHHSHPLRRRTRMDPSFRLSRPRGPSANRPPWRNLRHQASCTYRVKSW